MPDIWLILVVVGGLLALAAATVLAAGNRSRPDDMTEPMSRRQPTLVQRACSYPGRAK